MTRNDGPFIENSFRENTYRFGNSETRVIIGAGILNQIGEVLESSKGSAALIVTDENVAPLYGEAVFDNVRQSGCKATLSIIPPGDASKSLDHAAKLYDQLAQMRADRDAVIIAVGGGVVTDLAGFTAATWMRGVRSVYIPTTLEADVDACLGGKTGVNHSAGKNLIGAFHHPSLILIDPNCLNTLSDRDFRAGLAESIKHGAITGGDFLTWHETHIKEILNRDPATLASLIEKNVAIKADIVAADERELSNRRVFLNFGHTIGHAIEAEADYQLRHGECVALGIIAANDIALRRDVMGDSALAPADAHRIRDLIAAFGLPLKSPIPLERDDVLNRLLQDKKSAAGRPRFVLLRGLGEPEFRSDVPDAAIAAAVAETVAAALGT